MFTKTNWKNASPQNNHFFLKLYTLEEFAICAMSTSQIHNINSLEIESVSLVNIKTSYIYPTIYVIKDKMSSVLGRQARKDEVDKILLFFADNFICLTVTSIDDNGKFNNLRKNDEDSCFIIALMKNALIKNGYL